MVHLLVRIGQYEGVGSFIAPDCLLKFSAQPQAIRQVVRTSGAASSAQAHNHQA